MARNVVLVLDLEIDDDATPESVGEWMKVVLPLRGDTGQIQYVNSVAEDL